MPDGIVIFLTVSNKTTFIYFLSVKFSMFKSSNSLNNTMKESMWVLYEGCCNLRLKELEEKETEQRNNNGVGGFKTTGEKENWEMGMAKEVQKQSTRRSERQRAMD